MSPLFLASRLDVPLVPDAPGARDLLQRELSKPEYQTAQPSLWDIVSKAFWDWVNSSGCRVRARSPACSRSSR